MAEQTKPCTAVTTKAGMPAAYYQVHALLQTIRALASHEDDLCTLLAHIQRTGKLSAGVRRELEALLETLPVLSLESEMRSLWSAVHEEAA